MLKSSNKNTRIVNVYLENIQLINNMIYCLLWSGICLLRIVFFFFLFFFYSYFFFLYLFFFFFFFFFFFQSCCKYCQKHRNILESWAVYKFPNVMYYILCCNVSLTTLLSSHYFQDLYPLKIFKKCGNSGQKATPTTSSKEMIKINFEAMTTAKHHKE